MVLFFPFNDPHESSAQRRDKEITSNLLHPITVTSNEGLYVSFKILKKRETPCVGSHRGSHIPQVLLQWDPKQLSARQHHSSAALVQTLAPSAGVTSAGAPRHQALHIATLQILSRLHDTFNLSPDKEDISYNTELKERVDRSHVQLISVHFARSFSLPVSVASALRPLLSAACFVHREDTMTLTWSPAQEALL